MSPRSYQGRRLSTLLTVLALSACSSNEDDEQQMQELDSGMIDSGNGDGPDDLPDSDAQAEPPENDAEAAPPDAGAPDASEPDSGPGRQGISFTLLQGAVPVKDALVLFHNENGTLLETLTTDASGQVHSDLVPYLLTALPPAANLELFRGALSYVDVEDGDELVARLPPDIDEPALRAFTLTAPESAEAIDYYAYAGNADCSSYSGAGEPSFPIDLYARCFAETLDLVVVAIGENGPVGYLIAPDQAVPADGSTVALQGPWQAASTIAIGAVDMPDEPTIDVSYSQAGKRVGGGEAFGPDNANVWRLGYPGTFATEFDVRAGFEIPGVNENIYGRLLRRVTSADLLVFDGDDALEPMRVNPDLENEIETRPAFILQPSADQTDLAALFLELTLIDQEDVPAPNYFWTLVLPPGSESLTLPDTRQFADWFLGQTGASKRAEISYRASSVFEGDHASGYRAVRQGPLDFSLDSYHTLEPTRDTPSVWRRTDWSPPGT